MYIIFLTILILPFCNSSDLPAVQLRPKPKARAGGADEKAAPVFSVPLT
jgi:hypothetical protein